MFYSFKDLIPGELMIKLSLPNIHLKALNNWQIPITQIKNSNKAFFSESLYFERYGVPDKTVTKLAAPKNYSELNNIEQKEALEDGINKISYITSIPSFILADII